MVVARSSQRTVVTMKQTSHLSRQGFLRRGAPRGASMIELVTLLVVVGVALSLVVGQFVPTQREVVDKTGPVVIAAAVLDARSVASAAHYRYPGSGTAMASALNAVAATHSTSGVSSRYVTSPAQRMEVAHGKGTVDVSVSVDAPSTVGFAVLTSASGTDDGRCVLAVDSLRAGTTYASVDGVRVGSSACSGASAIACSSTWGSASGEGTAASPRRLTRDAACLRGN